MTKKDFELIAAVLKRTRPNTNKFDIDYTQWRTMVLEFGTELKLNNSRFNFDRFIEAAGIVE